MAKGKSKSKPRKPPTEKFLVVVDPWRYRNFFEDIGAWFEIMIKDDYPGTRVDMIYAQAGKHHNVIVQLPGHVDIQPLLGAHRHATILKPPHNMKTESVSYIFEYNFEREGHPRDWATVSPSYETIDPNFPIRFPYPIPSPVPQTHRNSKPGYAKQLPKDLWEDNGAAPTPQIQTDSIPISSVDSSSTPTTSLKTFPDVVETPQDVKSSQFTPYVPPSHHPSHTAYPEATRTNAVEKLTVKKESDHNNDLPTKKQDPYEQAAEAERQLRTDHRSLSGPSAKREYEDPAEAFLRSILPVKEENVSPAENYEPSSELLATMATLPQHLLDASSPSSTTTPSVALKREADITGPGDYRPSNELLATFATLPAQFLNQGADQNTKQLKQEETLYPPVKMETRDNDRFRLGFDSPSRARSVTLGAEVKNREQPKLMLEVKDESQDSLNAFSPNSAVGTRDPRKRPQAPGSGPVKKIKLERD